MPAGRPTKYNPAMCETVVNLGKEGASKAEICLELGISHDSFHTYVADYPEFSEAVKLSTKLSQGWWEREGRKATFGASPGFNATAFIFNMKNRFKEDWSDTTIQKTTVSLEKTVYDAISGETEGLPS